MDTGFHRCDDSLREHHIGKGTVLKDYVIRIHRHQKNDPRILVGVVEEVGVEGNRAFRNFDELWEILNSSKARTWKSKKPNKPSKLNKPDKAKPFVRRGRKAAGLCKEEDGRAAEG
jgi:hypothetical protein